VAEAQTLESLIRQGMECFGAKRFGEAVPVFQQALMIEPRHVGAAYMLSVALYFSGSFREAAYLFGQLTSPGSPLEPQKIAGLQELSNYSQYELLRLDHWHRLSQVGAKKIGKELKKRGWQPSSIEAFHLHLANGAAALWLEQNGEWFHGPTVRVTTRANENLILKGCRDADDSVGAHLEAIRDSAYVFLPLKDVRIIELGPLKRWMTAQAEFVDGARETLVLPLTYRDSMKQTARGVQEGVETITQPMEQGAELMQAFGQKQLRSETGQVAWSRILRLEIEPPAQGR